MRVTTIPAQVTTVEDRIVGSLNLNQLLLLSTPVFSGGLLYAILPPAMTASVYKLLILALLAATCGTLAVRIKGMIVLHWIAILFHYWQRPRFYAFDKRSMYGRRQYQAIPETAIEEAVGVPERIHVRPSLSFEDLTKVQELIRNPAAHVAFEMRKGGLYVHITEVKQEI